MIINKQYEKLLFSLKNDNYDLFTQQLFYYSDYINNYNLNGESLLHYASFYGMIDKYYSLINFGANIFDTINGNNLLHYASFSGKDYFLIVELIKSNILPYIENKNKQTALHFCKDDKITHYLNLWCIRNKINILNLIDIHGNTVAHSCISCGHLKAAEYWIKNYPDLSIIKNNKNQLWFEVKKQHYNFCI